MPYDEGLAVEQTITADVNAITIDETQSVVVYNGDGVLVTIPGPGIIMTGTDNVIGVGTPDEIADAVVNIVPGQIDSIHQGNYAPIHQAPPFEPPIILPPSIKPPADPPKGVV